MAADTVFVDLRDSAELECDGKIPGAVHVTRGMLEFARDPTLPYHHPAFSSGKHVIFYCASGGRSALAADTAQQMGLHHVSHLGRRIQSLVRSWRGSGERALGEAALRTISLSMMAWLKLPVA